MSLDTVVTALEGTGFELRVTFDDPPPTTPGAAQAVPSTPAQESDTPKAVPSTSAPESGSAEDVRIPPQAWLATDLVARVRGGSRRFPAHRVVIPVSDPPMWWWIHEFFSGPTEKPQWYAPEPAYDPFADWESSADDPSSGAA